MGSNLTEVPFRVLACLWMLCEPLAYANQDTLNVPQDIIQEIGIDQNLGSQIPADLVLYDEHGSRVRLGEYFGKGPMLLALVYYRCPNLCTLEINGILRVLQELRFQPGKEFDVLLVSMDPTETPALALTKKTNYLRNRISPNASDGLHFFTGDQPSIKRLAKSVGFRYRFDATSKQYLHPSAIMIVTPGGRISRYFFGIDYPARDLRLSLVEASANKIGSPIDQFLLFCYRFDPARGKYGIVVMNMLKVAGAATVLALGVLVFMLLRWERRRRRTAVKTEGIGSARE